MYQSQLYRSSPVPVQEYLLSLRARVRAWLREGGAMRRTLEALRRSQWLGTAELRRYQLEALQRVVRRAGAAVPYYRRLFAAIGFDAERFDDPVQLARLPVLRKPEVLDAYQDLVARGHLGARIKGATSGTTGASLALYRDLSAIVREHAHISRYLEWAGYRPGDRRVWFRGDMIVPAGAQKPPYWRVNRADNMLMVSSYHLSEESCAGYVRAMESFDPAVIQAYPSSIGYVAGWLLSRGRTARMPGLRGIVTSSETLTEPQRECIETAFGARVFDWYSMTERVAAIGSCEQGRYHVISDYGYAEFLPQEEGAFEVVGTGFGNALMPLIRYGTRDSVDPADHEERCSCGRSFPLVQRVWGRLDDLVVTRDGRHIGACLHGWLFEGVHGIAEAQLVQRRPGELEVRLVPTGPVDDRLREQILANARERLGDAMDITFREVPRLERSANGKLRFVISQLRDGARSAGAPPAPA